MPTQVEHDYLAGKWVPSYYGLKFTVANRTQGLMGVSEQDTSFKVPTFDEARVEADRRNKSDAPSGFTPAVVAMVTPWLTGDDERDAQSLRRRFRAVGMSIEQWRRLVAQCRNTIQR